MITFKGLFSYLLHILTVTFKHNLKQRNTVQSDVTDPYKIYANAQHFFRRK